MQKAQARSHQQDFGECKLTLTYVCMQLQKNTRTATTFETKLFSLTHNLYKLLKRYTKSKKQI